MEKFPKTPALNPEDKNQLVKQRAENEKEWKQAAREWNSQLPISDRIAAFLFLEGKLPKDVMLEEAYSLNEKSNEMRKLHPEDANLAIEELIQKWGNEYENQKAEKAKKGIKNASDAGSSNGLDNNGETVQPGVGDVPGDGVGL